jgi:putrescine:ornithine antiporter
VLYSTYAIYVSGKDAVLGGMSVTVIRFIIWGFIQRQHRLSGRGRLES